MVDFRKERLLIDKHVRQRHREAGEYITWFEYGPTVTGASVAAEGFSLYDSIYDQGYRGEGGRSYSTVLTLPTVYIEEFEDAANANEEGRQPTQNIRVVMLYSDVVNSGMTAPNEYAPHLNDVFAHDGRYYKVYQYRARGRLGRDVVVTVEGFEVMPDQEFMFDEGPPVPVIQDFPWPTAFP